MTDELIKDEQVELMISWQPGVDRMQVETSLEIRINHTHSFLVVKIDGKPIDLETKVKVREGGGSRGTIIVLDGRRTIQVTAKQAYPGDGRVTVVPLMHRDSARLAAVSAATSVPAAGNLSTPGCCMPRATPKSVRPMLI